MFAYVEQPPSFKDLTAVVQAVLLAIADSVAAFHAQNKVSCCCPAIASTSQIFTNFHNLQTCITSHASCHTALWSRAPLEYRVLARWPFEACAAAAFM